MSAHRGRCAALSRGVAPLSVGTFCPARGPKTLRSVMAAACSGRSVRACSPWASGALRSVWPMSSTSTPRRVSIFMRRAMMVPVHAVPHQPVQVDDQVGRGAEAPDWLDRATVTFVAPKTGSRQQIPREHALHHLQHRRDPLGLRGEQHAQRNRQRQHPRPHRHLGDDMVHQARRGLRHPRRIIRSECRLPGGAHPCVTPFR